MSIPVIAGINPQTRICDLVGVDDEGTWTECRENGLIPIKVDPRLARKLFGTKVPCLDALLPLAEPQRAIFAHVIAPELGDGFFYQIVTDSLRAIAGMNEETGGADSVRDGLWLGEGASRSHVSIHWPREED